MKINSSPSTIAQFQPKNASSQSACFYIECWRSHRQFMSRKSKWNKIQCSFIVLLYWMLIWQKTKPVASLSSEDPSSHFDYSYAHIYWVNTEYLLAGDWISVRRAVQLLLLLLLLLLAYRWIMYCIISLYWYVLVLSIIILYDNSKE